MGDLSGSITRKPLDDWSPAIPQPGRVRPRSDPEVCSRAGSEGRAVRRKCPCRNENLEVEDVVLARPRRSVPSATSQGLGGRGVVVTIGLLRPEHATSFCSPASRFIGRRRVAMRHRPVRYLRRPDRPTCSSVVAKRSTTHSWPGREGMWTPGRTRTGLGVVRRVGSPAGRECRRDFELLVSRRVWRIGFQYGRPEVPTIGPWLLRADARQGVRAAGR
jgi:hypothetical protein